MKAKAKRDHTLYRLYANTHMQSFKSGEESYGVLFEFFPGTVSKKVGFVTDDARVARQLAVCFQEMATQLEQDGDGTEIHENKGTA